MFTNHFEDICNDYFIIIFYAKKGIWTVGEGMSEFAKGIIRRMLVVCSFSSAVIIGSVG
jgi:hypothetical protein